MLVAERGGIRNLGLDAQNAFADAKRGARAALRARRQGHLAADRPLRRRLLRPPQGRLALHAGELLGRRRLRTGYDARPGSPTRASPTSSSGSRATSCARREGPCNLPEGGRRRPARRRRNLASASERRRQRPRCTASRVSRGLRSRSSRRNRLSPDASAGRHRRPRAQPVYLIDTDVNVDASGRVIESGARPQRRHQDRRRRDLPDLRAAEGVRLHAVHAVRSTRTTSATPARPRTAAPAATTASARTIRTGATAGGVPTSWFWSHWRRSFAQQGAQPLPRGFEEHSKERSHWREGSQGARQGAQSLARRLRTQQGA